MIFGSIYGWENGVDDIFDPHSSRNRDNCLEPMRVLERLSNHNGIHLHTADIIVRDKVVPHFSLYVESIDFVDCGAKKNYLILYETSLTVPRNADFNYLKKFDVIFTWDLDLVKNGFKDKFGNSISNNRFVQIHHPNPVPSKCAKDFKSLPYDSRLNFACLIGSNRHANLLDERELYSERVKAIQWFQKNAPSDFKLYGNGWSVPMKRLGRMGKLHYRIEKIFFWLMGRLAFPSYQGPIKTKYDVLMQTKFCICFENARDISGYITEKIFDCLFAGCIPIYWGDADVGGVIPHSCFIDFRKFACYQDLYLFLKNMTPEQYSSYQKAGQDFLNSARFTPFTSNSFASAVVSKIAQDFNISYEANTDLASV
jgi:hypothetical protein